ncbi:hypothetical protein HDU92_005883, partial [Lobulomyces angularis]
MSSKVAIKISFNNSLRQLHVDETTNWVQFSSKVRQVYQIEKIFPLIVTYMDEEGDIISVDTEFEFSDLIKQALVEKRTLRLEVQLQPAVENTEKSSDDGFVKISHLQRQDYDVMTSDPAEETVPSTSSLPSNLLTSKESQQPEAVAASLEGASSESNKTSTSHNEKGKSKVEEPKNPFETLLESFVPMFECVNNHLQDKNFIESLQEILKNNESQHEQLFEKILKNGSHLPFAAFFSDSYKDSCGSHPFQFGKCFTVGESSCNGYNNKENLGKNTNGVKLPWFGVTCDHCNKSNFTGVRFKCKICDDYDLCSNCHGKDKKVHEDHDFKALENFEQYRNYILVEKNLRVLNELGFFDE